MPRLKGTMKTERLTVRVTAQEKREIAQRAKALNLSIAEMIRRALNGGDMSGQDQAALDALADELERNADELRQAVRETLEEIAKTAAPFPTNKRRQKFG
jgi:hypothetical protein